MSPLLPYTNCCNVNLKDMLDNGFKMDEAYIETPQSIGVATSIAAQVIEAVSLSQLGGTSVPDIDITLAPYAKKNYNKHLKDARTFEIKDKESYAEALTKRDIYQAMQGLEYSINSVHSNGAQTPFVTLSFGRGVGRWESEIQKAMLNVRIKGLGNGISAIFPKLVFTIDKGINLTPEDPNYDVKQLALYCSARRDYPDIVFGKGIKEITGGSYMTSMGCRSFLPAWKNPKTGEYQIAGRLNLGVVTLNTVMVAMDSKDKDEFWLNLDKDAKLVHSALKTKIEIVSQETPEMAPILYEQGAIDRLKPNDDLVEKVFKHGRSTVSFGYIGLYETATRFYGPNWEHNPEAIQFTKSVVQYLHDKCAQWYKEEDFYYSLYSTPSEALTGRFCKLIEKKYGKVKDITDKGYLNNSFH